MAASHLFFTDNYHCKCEGKFFSSKIMRADTLKKINNDVHELIIYKKVAIFDKKNKNCQF